MNFTCIVPHPLKYNHYQNKMTNLFDFRSICCCLLDQFCGAARRHSGANGPSYYPLPGVGQHFQQCDYQYAKGRR